MSKRGADFVEKWIRENINAQAFLDEEGDDPRPKEAAEDCLRAAAARSILRAEIEEAVGGDLSATMARAIDAAANAEVRRLADKDD